VDRVVHATAVHCTASGGAILKRTIEAGLSAIFAEVGTSAGIWQVRCAERWAQPGDFRDAVLAQRFE